VKKVMGVIPARLESTRLERKMVRNLAGKTLLQWTYENARKAKSLADLVVACDDPELVRLVESFGGKAWITSKEHESGTSRIAEAARRLECDVIVNIQGDEPLVSGQAIDALAASLEKARDYEVSTPCVAKQDEAEYRSPNVVKVVKDRNDFALYFSRSPIPLYRDGSFRGFLKHLGLYAYTRRFLLEEWGRLEHSSLEEKERLEQLRILESGHKIKTITVAEDSIGVDTEEDFKKVEAILQGNLK
jgi:3-deoxy-manno-octulosonate cytidylyltransferase (CMP-KDO synthetase)